MAAAIPVDAVVCLRFFAIFTESVGIQSASWVIGNYHAVLFLHLQVLQAPDRLVDQVIVHRGAAWAWGGTARGSDGGLLRVPDDVFLPANKALSAAAERAERGVHSCAAEFASVVSGGVFALFDACADTGAVDDETYCVYAEVCVGGCKGDVPCAVDVHYGKEIASQSSAVWTVISL